MCGCNGGRDQTNEEALDAVHKAGIPFDSNELTGIGYFEVPAPEVGILETRLIVVSGLSYKETTKRGENCIGFKWVPIGIPVDIGNGHVVAVESPEHLAYLTRQAFPETGCPPCKRGNCSCPMGCYCKKCKGCYSSNQ